MLLSLVCIGGNYISLCIGGTKDFSKIISWPLMLGQLMHGT